MSTIKQRWSSSFKNKNFRNKWLLSFVSLLITVCFLPSFFQHIEKRSGIVLNDPLLKLLVPKDVSSYIFLIIWSVLLLAITRAVLQPLTCLLLLSAFTLLTWVRIITLLSVPLDAPPGLIPLIDPLSNAFYGTTFITKDLFFSGHTATMFLIFLCLPNKADKIFALLAAFAVAVLVLLQHVHYTIDVLAALVITYAVCRIAKRYAGGLAF